MAEIRIGPDRSAPQFCAFHSDTCVAVIAKPSRPGSNKGVIRTENIEFVIGERYHIYKRVPAPTPSDAQMALTILNIMQHMGYQVSQDDIKEAMEALK